MTLAVKRHSPTRKLIFLHFCTNKIFIAINHNIIGPRPIAPGIGTQLEPIATKHCITHSTSTALFTPFRRPHKNHKRYQKL